MLAKEMNLWSWAMYLWFDLLVPSLPSRMLQIVATSKIRHLCLQNKNHSLSIVCSLHFRTPAFVGRSRVSACHAEAVLMALENRRHRSFGLLSECMTKYQITNNNFHMHFIKSTSLTLPSLTLITHCTWSRFIWHDSSISNHVTCRILKQYTWQSSYYVIAESPIPQHTSPVSYGGASSPLSWFSMPTFGNGLLQGLETWLLTHTHTHTGPNAANDMHSPSAQLKNDTNPQTLKQTQACWTPKNRTLTSGALPCDSEDASFFGGCLSHCQKLLPSEMVSVIQPMALCVLPRVATLAQGCLWERKNYHMDSE